MEVETEGVVKSYREFCYEGKCKVSTIATPTPGAGRHQGPTLLSGSLRLFPVKVSPRPHHPYTKYPNTLNHTISPKSRQLFSRGSV